MKKYISLLISILTGLHYCYSQTNSKDIAIQLYAIDVASSASLYEISGSGGEFELDYTLMEYISQEEISSTLERAFRGWWLSPRDVIHPENPIAESEGKIIFYVEPNPDSEFRAGVFNINGCPFRVYQDPCPAIYTLLNRYNQYVYPDEEVTIMLNGSDINQEYHLFRDNTLVSRVMGTGRPISFQCRNIGLYTVKDANGLKQNGSVNVQYYQLFDGAYLGTTWQEIWQQPGVDSNGRSINITFLPNRLQINLVLNVLNPLDTAQLAELTHRLNLGQIPWWNNIVSIDMNYDERESKITFKLTAEDTPLPINITAPIPIKYESSEVCLNIFKEGRIIPYTISGTRVGDDRIDIHLSGSDERVLYSLYINDTFAAEQQGTGQPLIFADRTESGVYTMKGQYENNTVDMNGSVKFYPKPKPIFEGNWIQTRTYTAPDGQYCQDKITYYDGLGRAIQTNEIGISPSHNDLVSYQNYDQIGREAQQWLRVPFESNSGLFVPDTTFIRTSSLYYDDSYAYTEPIYESSPLNRVVAQFGPGEAWRSANRPTQTTYLTNSDDVELSCRILKIGGTKTAPTLNTSNETYPSGSLHVTKFTSEDNAVTYTFTNMLGQQLLVRSVDGDKLLDTYYVYDDLGNLCFVLPPMLSSSLGSSDFANGLGQYAYQYRYDRQNRCTGKKLPGTDWTYYIYDKGDNLLFSQDGEQRKNSQWAFMLYDCFKRPTVSGYCKGQFTAEQFGDLLPYTTRNAEGIYGYSIPSAIPADDIRIMQVYYYDDYSHNSMIASDALEYTEKEFFDKADSKKPQGLQTGTLSFAYGKDAPVYTSTYYDQKARPIQICSVNHLGGVSRVFNNYGFAGNLLKTREEHSISPDTEPTDNLETHTHYNHALLPDTAQYYLNDQHVETVTYAYDELNRLQKTSYGLTQDVISDRFSYNLRGWLTSKSNEKFSMTLAYNAPHHPQAAPSYTGNITEWNWTHADSGEENTYSFTYDSQSRLTDTRQYIDGLEVDQFVERNLSYDRNGNIQSLHRYEHGELKSNFAYTYTGNRLKTISDMQASPRSRSFANWGSADSLGGIRPDPIDPGIPIWPIDPVDPGNPGVIIPPVIDPVEPVDPTDPIGPIGPDNPGPGIVVPPGITDPTDPNPGGGIDPDIPSVVVRPGDPDKPTEPTEPGIRQDSIYSGSEYVYDVNGNMLYDPMEGLNIRYNHLNLIEKALRGDTIVAKYSYLSDGTKLSATDADGNGLYYLGSLVYGSRNGDLSLESAAFNGGRFIVTSNGIESHYFVTDHLGSVRAVVNNDGEVIERNDYYPFGLRWNAGELSDNRYRYNGKETQSFVDVPYTDYGARMLDSKYRVNWFNIDQLLEKHHSLSPYLYCGGNPISRIDILGLDFWTTTDPRLINQFLQQLIESGSFSPDGWTHFTDDEFLNDDPESNSYLWRSDSGNSFFVWKTSDVNGVYVNSYKLPDIPTSFDLYASLNNKDLDIASNLIAGVGITAGVGEQLLFSSKLETWMGRDLKIRSQNWGGNQYTGGKIKFASKYAKYFKWAGFAATAASAYNIELMYRKGQICKEQYYIEQASNAVSMVPFYGTAWAFGWDMGKVCASWLK